MATLTQVGSNIVWAPGSASWYIGNNAAANRVYAGRSAWFTVWNAILTADEAAAFCAGVNPRSIRPGNIVECLPLWGLHSAEISLAGSGTPTVTGTSRGADDPPVQPWSPFRRATFFDFAASSVVTVSPARSTHGHSAGSMSASQIHALSMARAMHGLASSEPSLSQTYEVSPARAVHGHATDAPSLTQSQTLSPARARHGQATDAASMLLAGSVQPADATHRQAADGPAITQNHVLAPARSTHGHAATAAGASLNYDLTPARAVHGQGVDLAQLAQTHAITPARAVHAVVSAATEMLVAGILTPARSSHALLSTSVELTQDHQLSTARAVHAHLADAITASVTSIISPDSTTHGHEATGPALVQVHVITPDRSTHGHRPTASQVQGTVVVLEPARSVHGQTAARPSSVIRRLTMREAALRQLVAKFTTIVAGQPTDDPYNFAWDIVSRAEVPDAAAKGKKAVMEVLEEIERKQPVIGQMIATLRVIVTFRVHVATADSPAEAFNEVLGEIQRRVREDITLSDTVINIQEAGNKVDVGGWADRRIAGEVHYDLQYRHAENDPRRYA